MANSPAQQPLASQSAAELCAVAPTGLPPEAKRQALYARLMLNPSGDPLQDLLARILATWSSGGGALPQWLGLDEDQFERMMEHYFPHLQSQRLAHTAAPLPQGRIDEMEELHTLLMEHRSGSAADHSWLVQIVIAGCMGSDHLWQDLGLWCREDLSRLMSENFAPLAARNSRDMKWKKFLYKQLCETEGIYTCRAPSCEVCRDYDGCYGPET